MTPSEKYEHIINIDDDSHEFQNFDVVSNDSGHHYINSNKNKGDIFSNSNSDVNKRIMKEWKILKNHLPENIYVRGYDNRIDLLRAVIVGASGTPYHDGLFFFDIAFPPVYPTKPPKVYYHSFGFQINPNMYKNGVVCLSLLGTTIGKEEENWDPSKSTILQVLVSIQALILTEKPFYNIPGAWLMGHFGERIISPVYTEEAFVLSCQTMLRVLNKPPRNFEDLVKWHFRERAEVILKACIAYANGEMRIGSYGYNGPLSSSSRISSSDNFKYKMRFVYKDLRLAFKKTRASLETSVEQLVVDTNEPSDDSCSEFWAHLLCLIIGAVIYFLFFSREIRDFESEAR